MNQRLRSFFLNSSIKIKLELMVMTITFVTLLLASSAFLIYDNITAKAASLSELRLLGEIISKRIAPVMIFEDADKATKILADLSTKDSVTLACLYTAEGNLLAIYQQTGISVNCAKSLDGVSAQESGGMTIKQIIRAPNGNEAGTLVVISDMRELTGHLLHSIAGMLLLIIAAMGGALLMTMKAQGAISTPIMDLASTARMVSEHSNYSLRADKYYQDELGLLVESFNQMMDEVEKRDKELQGMNEMLESKVKERTRALEEAKMKAESANEAKSEFLRNMSHEFRTPLHAMTSFSLFGMNETETDTLQETLHRYFVNINKSAGRLTHLVDSMLNIARLESGQELLTMHHCDLRTVLDGVVSEQQGLMRQKNITVSCESKDIDTEIICDEMKISQVITNILGNAIKFSKEQGIITVTFSRESRLLHSNGEYVEALVVCMSDQGVGIPEGEEDKIFEKFIQSSRTNSGAGGTGLGLAICKGIVEAHRGLIWAENNKAMAATTGASFYFALPVDWPEGQFIVTL